MKAVHGGSHPGVGTRNALLSLGDQSYLEIIAPDPAQTAFRFRIDLPSLTEPRLISWAATGENLEAIRRVCESAGYRVLGPEEGARARPDGKKLRWTVLWVRSGFDQPGVEAMPFFITWEEGSIHPSQDSTPGCRLTSFRILHPDPVALHDAMQRFGIQADVERGPQVRLVASLDTPKGKVEIS